MKLAIDCRYLGKSGIGRVCRGILDNLDYAENEYYLVGDPDKLAGYVGAHIIPDRSDPFSPKGITSFPKEINKLCDGVLIPNFIIPFGLKIPVYTVVHDLIFLDLPDITTKGRTDYLIKKTLLARCMKKSVKTACVSAFTKSRKPHKGLKTLVDAFHMLPKGSYKLKIIGEREGFLVGMDERCLRSDDVMFTGRLDDDELLCEIASASYLVQPSLYEGFGLPPLEALCLGTQPIISDIPVFREVYGDLPVEFFRCGDAEDLKKIILSSDGSDDGKAGCCANACKSLILEKYNYRMFTQKLISCFTE